MRKEDVSSIAFERACADFREALKKRILILDGGMGTMIQTYGLCAQDYCCPSVPKPHAPHADKGGVCPEGGSHDLAETMQGNHDILPLTRPEIIEAIHRAYLEAGADIIETCSFGANAIGQKKYGTGDQAEAMCRASARIARKTVAAFERRTHKRCFVAGSVGPTGISLSIASDVDDPAKRTLDFDTLKAAYETQMYALLDEGVDFLMVETVFDGLNARAAACACQDACRRLMRDRGLPERDLPFCPILFSATLADAHGRLLNGQTFAAFVDTMTPFNPLAIGFNCGFGVKELSAFVRALAFRTTLPVIFYPNAGLPDANGVYSDSPDRMAARLAELAGEGLLNIVGGCCGTMPEHIHAIARAVCGMKPRAVLPVSRGIPSYAGLEPLQCKPDERILVAERTNVTGSKKFRRLIVSGAWDDAVTVARDQMHAGAQMLDICMDDALIDGTSCMKTFLRMVGADPDVSKYPFVIDSSHFDVIRTAMREIPGRCLINSISLKNGEEAFLAQAREIKAFGHGVVVMAFDERGQAANTERRVEILSRAVTLLREKIGFSVESIAVDPNILAIGTGMPEHDGQALSFIETCQKMRETFVGIQTIGGLSNLSFAFRGRDDVRSAIHTSFLRAAGDALTMVIANPSLLASPDASDPELCSLADDLVHGVCGSLDRLLSWMASHGPSQSHPVTRGSTEAQLSPQERIIYAFTRGLNRWLEQDIRTLRESMTPLQVIEGPLMDAMNVVGERFGKAEMFLPEVVRSARMMKQAIGFLGMDQAHGEENRKKVLLATVFGDVHDIGKNIVSVVLSCNGYEVIDLGVMVPTSKIVSTALEHHVDAVGLSGLITPSLQVMVEVASAMREAGLTMPLFVGGAATGMLHTALKIAPAYAPGLATHIADASQVPGVLGPWLNPATRQKTEAQIRARHAQVLAKMQTEERTCSLEEARKLKPHLDYPPNPALDAAPRERMLFSWTADTLQAFLVKASLFRAVRIVDPPKATVHAHQTKLETDFYALIRAAEACHCLRTQACYRFVPAFPEHETIVCRDDASLVRLPGIRALGRDLPHFTLADFLAPGRDTPIGLFALSCPLTQADIAALARFLAWGEDYTALLAQALATELVSAACDRLHQSLAESYGKCIRPAFGYPIAPDHALKEPVLKLLHAEDIGITLTPSYMMVPLASICGMTIFHPNAVLFKV